MAAPSFRLAARPDPGWPDERLIDGCLAGDPDAWEAFVDKYRKLVYAIVVRYSADGEEAADLFQAVWLDVYNDLPKLRAREAVRGWLAQLARNKCFHASERRRSRLRRELPAEEQGGLEEIADPRPADEEDREIERDQLVRDAIGRLSARCREMVQLLFFTQPPLPYKEVAERLGLATGSIGFIRGRCLKKLQAALEALGLS